MRFARLDMRERRGAAHRRRRRASSTTLRGRNGAVRAGALLTMLDSVGGVCGGLASLPDGWVVSTNLARGTVAPRADRSAHASTSRRPAQGPQQRRDLGARSRDAATATRSSWTACSRPRSSSPRTGRPCGNVRCGSAIRSAVDYLPMDAWLDAPRRRRDTRRDRPRATTLRNPWGILHGGVVATLVDLAAEHATGGGARPTSCCTSSRRTASARCARTVRRRSAARSDGDVVPRRESATTGADRVTAVAITHRPSLISASGVNSTGRCSRSS